MLASLSIRDVVLIDRLDLSYEPGLSVLTGETGAGKSILLDALGLALGERADSGLVRHGADQATVIAAFELADPSAADAVLGEADLHPSDGSLILRRVVTADGRSRAYVNDQPTSVGLMRRLGDVLVEIQGQFDQRGLMDPSTHRDTLDAFAGLTRQADGVAKAWSAWRTALVALESARADLEKARSDEEYLRHSVAELDQIAPQVGEEGRLAETRSMLMNAEAVVEALNTASAAIAEDGGADNAVARAQRALERVADRAGGRLDTALAALDRAAAELEDASAEIAAAAADIEADGGTLTEIDDRLHALRDLARKHGVEVDRLPEVHRRFADHLAALDGKGGEIGALTAAEDRARRTYIETAEVLSKARAAAAAKLDVAIGKELPPLKLDKARFETMVSRQEENRWGAAGLDAVAFQVATNPGMPAGPLSKIASGGELSRFLLALKVVLAEASPIPTLVFDEVDSGVGGAVAAAVGDRLARLATRLQVLVVTHSPQVAAQGAHHWHVAKRVQNQVTATDVVRLSAEQRREEIARMLSGAAITSEARAAADSLLNQSQR
ncbi:DNA repair protein RecN [Thalassobaculum sp. OXR-137]|uniref:DNA repair protein RecN n=1 Tax=Thalassobaculum sp. OXR-137 TaxID=3100173 RepID=UPI002AC9CD71|nr:DNA repair protein RecN [Thalassobaculum sp. OXR-137]WPZ36149.1 DNA repair protein RecN [Thalassobaculum sp. OXR-137]